MQKLMIVIAMVMFLSGCATLSEKQSIIQRPISKGKPVVYIYPMDMSAYLQASVGVLPFSMPGNMDARMGNGIALLFKDVLLGKRTFPKVRLLADSYGDYEQAIAIGQQSGTDLVLAGKVNYMLEGTELGGARLDVSLRLLNVSTGRTVWHIGQAMDQPMGYPETDFWSTLSGSFTPPPIMKPMGPPAVTNMLAQAAVDMADVLGGAKYVRR